MKKLLLLCALPIMILANGGGYPPGDGDNNVKYDGKIYRCFKYLGHSLSYAKNNSQWAGHGTYCLPNRPTHCLKSWHWSVDGKDDKVEETEQSKKCQFTSCKLNGGGNDPNAHVFINGAGSWNPINTYSYCAIEKDERHGSPNEFLQMAKCVEKNSGEEKPVSLCDADAMGQNYYYKPKCDAGDDEKTCNEKLLKISNSQSWNMRFCYRPWEGGAPGGGTIKVFLDNQGGQTVRFRGFTNNMGWKSGPCEQMALPITSGGTPPPDPDKPKEPLGKLVIIDWEDSKQAISKVHTKVSGNSYDFKIYAESGSIDSGLQSATCQITDSGAQVLHSGNAGSAFSWNSLWAMKYSAPKSAFPKSGKYTIKCSGKNKDGDSAEAEVDFLVAPHLYQFGVVSLNFDKDGNPISEALNAQAIRVENKKVETLKHSNDNWKRKPVIKINKELKLQVKEVIAYTADGKVDEGVDVSSDVNGVISMQQDKSKSTTQAITSETPLKGGTPSVSNASGACAITPQITANNAEMTKGLIANAESIATLSADNALVANAEVLILDSVLQEQIKQQEASGLCDGNGGKFPCPYPGAIKAEFDYQIVPSDFQVELKTHKGADLKVLYLGQGYTPAVEKGVKLVITALKNEFDANNPNNDIATTFSNNCAAQDMTFALNAANGTIKIELVDKSGKVETAKVPYSSFVNGKITLDDAILKVTKNNTPFTPNMKSEPIIIDKNTLKNDMGFFGFENSYYPKYTNIANANLDMVILRARINAIDTDNAPKFGTANNSKVLYEFQCEYCDIGRVYNIIGRGAYDNKKDRSPTQQGWWIDRTFSEYNAVQVEKNRSEIENLGNTQIRMISGVTNGMQEIAYSFLSAGTYKLNILHGNFVNGATPASMPNFLLYNAYWNANVKWNTSAFIYIKGEAKDEQRNYGIDTGGAKNTRSGGRTGKY
ncbi:hypothetical protein ACWIUD_00980 [Helicobacter sp. 23-1044]